jgi:hypothetical protein
MTRFNQIRVTSFEKTAKDLQNLMISIGVILDWFDMKSVFKLVSKL